MDPKKKKDILLKHERRHCGGDNNKSSRKAVRFRKRWVNKTYRRGVKQAVASVGFDEVESSVANVQRPGWKKYADQPLGEVLLESVIQEIVAIVKQGDNVLLEILESRLIAQGWARPGVTVLIRQLHSCALDIWPRTLVNVDLPTARALFNVLGQIASEQYD